MPHCAGSCHLPVNLQIGQLDEKLGELEAERAELQVRLRVQPLCCLPATRHRLHSCRCAVMCHSKPSAAASALPMLQQEYQRHDRARRSLEYTIYDKELTKIKADIEKVGRGDWWACSLSAALFCEAGCVLSALSATCCTSLPVAPPQLEEEKAAHAERQGRVHDELREAQVRWRSSPGWRGWSCVRFCGRQRLMRVRAVFGLEGSLLPGAVPFVCWVNPPVCLLSIMQARLKVVERELKTLAAQQKALATQKQVRTARLAEPALHCQPCLLVCSCCWLAWPAPWACLLTDLPIHTHTHTHTIRSWRGNARLPSARRRALSWMWPTWRTSCRATRVGDNCS